VCSSDLELRKVIWPNRKQMVNYTAVVLVFLVFMVTLIGLVDLGLARLVLLIFGDNGA
jgi:preprotein translocase subunit SecE